MVAMWLLTGPGQRNPPSNPYENEFVLASTSMFDCFRKIKPFNVKTALFSLVLHQFKWRWSDTHRCVVSPRALLQWHLPLVFSLWQCSHITVRLAWRHNNLNMHQLYVSASRLTKDQPRLNSFRITYLLYAFQKPGLVCFNLYKRQNWV